MWRILLFSCHLVMIIFLNVSFHKCEESSACPKDHYTGNNSRCQPCTQCSDGFMLVESCTNQSDTVCRSCDLGTYSTGGFKCQNCSQCQPGTYVSRHCTLTSDTQCQPCAKNMYSSDWSAGFCMPCSRCSRAMTVERNCSKTHDYKCGDCIEGYYRHPNLPSTCIKCSYCYPDHPGATVVVDECLTKSRDPTMTCMPLLGGWPLKSYGTQAKNRKSATTSLPASPPTIPTVHMISSAPFLYDESYSVPIPPNVAIIIIIVCIILIIIILAIFCTLHKRKQLPKKSETLSFLSQMCHCKNSDLKMKDGKEIPPYTQKSKQVEFVITHEPGSNNDARGRARTFDDEVPMVSCSQCLIHYGIGGGLDSNEATIGQNNARDEPPVRETYTVEIDVVERSHPSPVNKLPKDSKANGISDSGHDLTDASNHECGTENSGNSVEKRTSLADNNGFEREETSVTQPSPPVSIQEKDEKHQGEGSQGASEPLVVPANKTLMSLTRSSDVGSYDSDDGGLSCVQPESVMISSLNATIVPTRLAQRMDRGIAEGGTDTDRAENVSRHCGSAENVSDHRGRAPQADLCRAPDALNPRGLQRLMSSRGDAGSDSDGSSPRSAMSSDYDSDVVVNRTLLGRGQSRSASGERRRGRVKKKTKRHSNQGVR
ncbi:uncharacterized protein LOC124117492 [Haliotis rufescens]|uniref:uncharacterized protein LOC124117492 n=1 Tax=Haliotis rufescens TaxID=6454 RepID=UPI00201F0D37|nr:uncharacterized protein LOC124117492 [Haliotis rufescens]